MGTTTPLTVQDYLRDFGDSSCEYVDGVVIEKPKPTWMHSVLQGWLGGLIMRLYPQYLAGSETHSRIKENEYRLPDIAVQLKAVVRQEQYAVTPLVLCVEILSPDDSLSATFAKCEIYHSWGVPVCWVIDPATRRAWTYARDGEPAQQSAALEAGDIRLTFADIFSPFN